MTTNPYQAPNELIESASGDSDALGAMLAEYRVSRIVTRASFLLTIVSGGLCLLVTSELFTSEYKSVWEPLSVLGILLAIAVASALSTVTAARTRFAVFERGIVSCNAIETRVIYYADVSDMYISKPGANPIGTTLNPLKPHLVILVGSQNAVEHYLCPFLIPTTELFNTAVNAWSTTACR